MTGAVYTEFLKDLIVDILLDNGVYTEETIQTASVNDRVEAAAPFIFEGDIPFFDNDYRLPLEKKILRHYYMREIGQETPEAFLLYLNNDMYEKMPFYNKLYESELIKFDPLYTVNKTVIHSGTKKDDREVDNDSSAVSSQASKDHAERQTENAQSAASSNKQENKQNDNSVSASNAGAENTGGFLDTPQGALTGLSDSMDILNGSTTAATGGYLTNAQMGKSDSKSSTATHGDSSSEQEGQQASASKSKGKDIGDSTSQNAEVVKNKGQQKDKGNSTDAYIDKITGYDGRYAADAIKAFRDTFLNIDLDLIKGLNNNFMMVY